MSLSGCQIEETSVRKLRPDVYDISHLDCGFTQAANDAASDPLLERLRPAIDKRARQYCPSGYQLSDVALSNSGMRGSAVTGECPTVTLHATVHCEAAHPRD